MIKKPNSEIILYQSIDGSTKIDVILDNETVWLSQEQMSELFQTTKQNIGQHIKNVFKEGELRQNSVVKDYFTTASDGKNYTVSHYNLDVIISVGYRVKSLRGTQFRIWATQRLKEYIIKGFIMDDERLKNLGGGGYWKELIARIRDIRASEKVFYRQILDIYATSIDYDTHSTTSIKFFKTVQNKIHYAIHGKTAAEIIYTRADAEKKFMGLTSFLGTNPQLKDAVTAKNYLNEKELRALGQLVSGYLDFAERQAEKEIPMKMKDWSKHLDNILISTGEKLLIDAGKISHKKAVGKAKTEYKSFQQKTLSSVEKVYLNTIRSIQKKLAKKNKKI